MNSLPIRALSAAVAIALMIGLYYFFGLSGMHVVVFSVVILGGRELIKILFLPEDSRLDRVLFYFSVVLIYIFSVRFFERMAVIFVAISILYFSLNLWRHRSENNPVLISSRNARSLMGFFYLGLLPVFADRLLVLEQGIVWFVVLLAVVLTGDTFAYIAGVSFGKHKIMPNISPKKSVEGSLGGLLGSATAALIASSFLPQVPPYFLVLMGLCVGMIGQFGDFFESLLKRVADVKDSGSIMPGHGGLLDRLDGILFAAPFVYLTASLWSGL